MHSEIGVFARIAVFCVHSVFVEHSDTLDFGGDLKLSGTSAYTCTIYKILLLHFNMFFHFG